MGMKGLALSRAYFSEAIRPLLAKRVTEIGQSYAAALLGWGSDVLGNDDALSRDHEWGPRCLLFLPEPLIRHREKVLNALNRHLPIEFRGHPTRFVTDPKNPTVRVPAKDSTGHVHVEVTTCDEYLAQSIGTLTPKSEIEWLTIPEGSLLGLTRGEVFWGRNWRAHPLPQVLPILSPKCLEIQASLRMAGIGVGHRLDRSMRRERGCPVSQT